MMRLKLARININKPTFIIFDSTKNKSDKRRDRLILSKGGKNAASELFGAEVLSDSGGRLF